MASETFHPFARLPGELRDCFWDLAALALEDRPAAHFFTLVNIKEDMPFISFNDTIGERGEGSYCLAAPQL